VVPVRRPDVPSSRPARPRPRRIAFLGALPAALVGVLLASGCGASGSDGGRLDVLLISLDTLRADRLGCYGHDRPTSPALDAFAATGARFVTAIAESPWTLPSHVTMLSGLHPRSHGVGLPALRPADETRLLAEILLDAGYRTFATTDGGYVDGAHGFGRGFEIFADTDVPLPDALASTREWIESSDDRYFAFVHTYDIHCPYHPDPAIAARFETDDAVFIETAGRCGNPHFNQLVLRDGQLTHLSNQYDAGIREADDALAPFLDWLASSGRLEHTLVIVTSDHGEELGEHGQIGHERTLHREVLEIPLIIAGAGIEPRVIETSAGLVDLVPTILDLLELPPAPALDGTSLRSALEGTDDARWRSRPAELVWKLPLRSIVTPDHQLIEHIRADRVALYDWHADLRQEHDLADAAPAVVDSLLAELDRFEAAHPPGEARPVETLTPEQRARLRSLGYVD